jgi:hypothetical protein
MMTVGDRPLIKNGDFIKVKIDDRREFYGNVLSNDPEMIVIEDLWGERVEIASIYITDVILDPKVYITPEGKIWLADPNATRYLYGPSAFTLKQGQSYFSQKSLLFSEFAIGATDWLAFSAGTALPLLFFQGWNFSFAAKAGGPVNRGKTVHLAGGMQTILLPFAYNSDRSGTSTGAVFGLPFATLTLGKPERNISITAGAPFVLNGSDQPIGNLLVSFAGNFRVSKKVSLVTENWLFAVDPDYENFLLLNGLTPRIIWPKFALDTGVVIITDTSDFGFSIPLPWVDFTWNFGR